MIVITENGKLIGEGLQYFVYESGNGRVKKVPKTKEEMHEHLKDWYDSEEKRRENVEKAIKRRNTAVSKLKKKEGELGSVFGNLEFIEEAVYQNRVLPTDEVLEKRDIQGNKEVVDDYIELVKKLWRMGIGDTIYNFTINTGYNKDGDIIQLDFGEIVFSKEKVRDEIKGEKWLRQWSYTDDMNSDLKKYFRIRMSEELDSRCLDRIWKDKES